MQIKTLRRHHLYNRELAILVGKMTILPLNCEGICRSIWPKLHLHTKTYLWYVFMQNQLQILTIHPNLVPTWPREVWSKIKSTWYSFPAEAYHHLEF